MKKHLLTSFALMLGIAAGAQTYFSQTIGTNTPSGSYNSGLGSVKTSNGNIITVAVSQAGGFEIRTFNSAGTMLLTTKLANTSVTINEIAYVTELDASSLLVTGVGTQAGNIFYVAKVNLLTNEVTITTKPNDSFSYTKGPRAVKSSSAIYVSFPQYSRFDLNKFDFNLNPIWSKRCEDDPSSGKNPGNDCGIRDDSTIVIVGKCDTTLGCGDYDEDGDFDSLRLFQINGYTRMYAMGNSVDGGMFMAGFNTGAVTMTNSPVLIKLAHDNSIVWAKMLDAGSSAGVFARFVDVEELPNGNIVAFGTTYEAYSDTYFNGACIFDANGNLLSTKLFGSQVSGTGKYYNLYDAKVYNDGILMSGVITDYNNGGEIINTVIFCDYNFNTVCDKSEVSPVCSNLPHGVTKVHGPSEVTLGDNPLCTTSNYGLLSMGANTTPEVCSITTGLNEIETTSTSLYPNPVAAGNNITLTLSAAGNYTVNVISTTGAIVSTATVNGTIAAIGTQNMTAGLYIVNVYQNGVRISSDKIAVK